MTKTDFTPIYYALASGDKDELQNLVSTLNPAIIAELLSGLSDQQQMRVLLSLEEDVSDTMCHKADMMTGVDSREKARDVLFSKKLTKGNILYPVRLRIAFLFITLVGGFLVGSIIDRFEDLLSAIIVAAIFIPVIMDMGGNVGTQSTTIFARGLALGPRRVEGAHPGLTGHERLAAATVWPCHDPSSSSPACATSSPCGPSRRARAPGPGGMAASASDGVPMDRRRCAQHGCGAVVLCILLHGAPSRHRYSDGGRVLRPRGRGRRSDRAVRRALGRRIPRLHRTDDRDLGTP